MWFVVPAAKVLVQGNKGTRGSTMIKRMRRWFQLRLATSKSTFVGKKTKTNKQKKTLTLDTFFFFPRRIFHNFRTMQNDWTADTIRQRRDDSVYSPQCFEISRTRPAELRGRCRLTSLPTGEFTLSHQAAGTKAKAGGDEKKKGGADLNQKQSYSKVNTPVSPDSSQVPRLLSLQGPLCSKCVPLRSNFHWL